MANIDLDNYYSRGSHAYDLPVKNRPKRTPRPTPRLAPRQRRLSVPNIVVKQGISKHTLLLLLALFACAFMAVYYVASVQYNHRQLRQTSAEITRIQREITNARSIINSSYNLAEVEEAAERLGLSRPAPHQERRIYIRR